MEIADFLHFRLSEEHRIKPFDYDNKDLNDFLFNNAKAYQAKLMAATYIVEKRDKTAAFYSLLNDKVTVENFDSKSQYKKLIQKVLPWEKRRDSYPAMKIGRLAVDDSYKGKGLGKEILNYIKILFWDNNRTGCRFITVDSLQESSRFYERNGFRYMTTNDANDESRLMFFDLYSLVSI